ncbi:MAG TPA: DUF6325 family protein [Candidatus Saccharimonadales bacterium]|nr:DUF6325 family protein [Candidatus Saccharimonadales bacterium]
MRGPIDYIIVGFEGNKFDGSILKVLSEAIDKGTIGLVALMVVSKDKKGTVTKLNISDLGDESVVEFAQKYKVDDKATDSSDVDEVADLLQNNSTAGLLAVEHLWAKPLKKALLDANGVLLAEGRIHPEAAAELEK